MATRTKKKTARKARPTGKLALLIGTAKGGFALEAVSGRSKWRLRGPFKLGAKTHDLRSDPRNSKTLLMSSTGGHLGPTIYRSTNAGKTWTEAEHSPRFAKLTAKSPKGKRARASRGQSVRTNFWLEPGHADEPGVWYCGTSPQGLFRSEDDGRTWAGVEGFNFNPMWSRWISVGKDGTPDGPVLHSIQIDPRDLNHMTVSCSSGGTFESLDCGKSWRPLNEGVQADYLPSDDVAYGHDPHCMLMHPADPDRWYQQNHCGIYRLDRASGETWSRIGKRMPKRVGDVGFPVVAHPTDPDTIWVFPMDGTNIWPRTSPSGRPSIYVTRDGGRRWEAQGEGLPETAYWTVLRQAMASDANARNTGLYFGTTSGEIWGSINGGDTWRSLASHLPRIYSLRVGRI